jgi:DNA-binding CsgD family transcriptional regulator
MKADLLTVAEYRTLSAYAALGDQESAAQSLHISPQTVKNELTSAYKKLGARSNIEAFRVMGWLRLPHEDRREADLLALGLSEAAIAIRNDSRMSEDAIKRTSEPSVRGLGQCNRADDMASSFS